MALCLRTSSRTSHDLTTCCFATKDINRGKNRMRLGIAQANLALLSVFSVFALVMAESWYKTVLYFRAARKLAFWRKTGSAGRKAKGLSHHEWVFYCFCLYHINFRKLFSLLSAKVRKISHIQCTWEIFFTDGDYSSAYSSEGRKQGQGLTTLGSSQWPRIWASG